MANAKLNIDQTPKYIDSSGNETSLTTNTVVGVANTWEEYKYSIATASTDIVLDGMASTLIFEFISDVAVTFDIYDAATKKATFTDCTYLCVSGTAISTAVYKITNASGSTANIVWRQGK